MVTIGFDKQCITPELPVALSGYAGKRIANGIHDELYTRCISMEYNGQRYLLAQCDCLAVDEALRIAVLTELTDLNLPNEHFVLTATHTHSGPAGTIDTGIAPFSCLTDVFGTSSPVYRKKLANQIALAVCKHTHCKEEVKQQCEVCNRTRDYTIHRAHVYHKENKCHDK